MPAQRLQKRQRLHHRPAVFVLPVVEGERNRSGEDQESGK